MSGAAKQRALELGQERGSAVVMPRGQMEGVDKAAAAVDVDRARDGVVLLDMEEDAVVLEAAAGAEAIFLAPQTALLVLAVPTRFFM